MCLLRMAARAAILGVAWNDSDESSTQVPAVPRDVKQFRASGRRGFMLRRQHGSVLRARTRPIEVSVEIAQVGQPVPTAEGDVDAWPGDAIVTGVMGERWPVSRGRFLQTYDAERGTCAGDSGLYRKRVRPVRALQVHEPFKVVIEEGVRELIGQPGDWLLDYGNGDLGVVADEVFDLIYERGSAFRG